MQEKIRTLLSKNGIAFLFLAAGALLTGLTLVFPQAGFIEWVSLVPVALVMITYFSDRNVRLRKAYAYGFFFFMCYFMVTFHWFINLYPLDFIAGMTKGAAVAVVLVAWIGLSFLQTVSGGIVFVLFALICRTRFAEKNGFVKPFAAAALWAIFEWTQTLGWFGVPWGRLPIGQSAYLAELQTASWFGSYFITFLLVAVNFCVAYAVLYADRRRLSLCVASGLLIFNTVAGTLLYCFPSKDGEKVKISAVQGNISSKDKWDENSIGKTLDVYEKYTRMAADEGAEIVVWPESALPYTLAASAPLQNYLSTLARETGVTILVGAFTLNEDGETLNSVIPVFPDGTIGENVYSKRHLVPFGEYVPMRNLISTLIPPLAELVMLDSDLAEGEGAQILYLNGVDVGALICFDSIYEELTRESVLGGAQVITLSTNDSWFSDSAALYMHNAQAQLRAIESGRYVVRAANTGISTIIDSNGNILSELDPLVDGYITAEVTLSDSLTLYTIIGNSFVYLLILAILLLLSVDFSREIRKVIKRIK